MASMPSHSHGHRRVDTQADSQVAAVADQTGRVHRRRGGRWSHPVRGGLHHPRPVRPGRADPGAAGGAPGRDDGAGRRRRPTAPPCRCRPPSIAQPAAQVPDHKALARACLALRPEPRAILSRPPRRPWGPGPALAVPAGGTGRPGCRAHKLVSPTAPALWPGPAWPGHRRAAAGTAGDNPGGWAARPPWLGCGVARLPASSGGPTVTGSTGGDRHANHALWRITLVHMPCHVDFPPGGGHRGYAAVVDGGGLRVEQTKQGYGQLLPEADRPLRDRLDARWSASGADGDRLRPQRSLGGAPSVSHGTKRRGTDRTCPCRPWSGRVTTTRSWVP
jgi:hypothetical protein